MKVGKISGNVLRRSVLQQIKTKRDEVVIGAAFGEDCAVFSLIGKQNPSNNDTCVTISCVQEDFLSKEVPLTALLHRCRNAVAAKSGELFAVSLTFLFPETAEEMQLKQIMADAETFCKDCHVQIAEVKSRVAKAAVQTYATVTGYGTAAVCKTVRSIRSGQDIVVSKWIGLEGTAVLAKRYRTDLLKRYPAWLTEEAEGFDRYLSTVPEAAVAAKSGVCAMYNVSEGGIFAALWELAESAGVGLTIDLKKLPLRQETVEICNHCNRNPYELLSGGSLIMIHEDGPALAAKLGQAEIPAVVVGKITDSNDRLILNEDEVRYLDRPQPDSIY